jgi:hypothetical protein
MTYEVVENFAAGLDNRKSPLTAPGGTLTKLTNAVINPGGEIEKRRAFVHMATVTGSFGLAATSNSLFVFGRNVLPAAPALTADGTALAAAGTTIKRLIVPEATASLEQTDADVFDGKVYIACSGGSPSSNPHFYDDENIANGTMIATQGVNKGYAIRTFQSKMYAVISKYLYFSAIGNPILWDAPLAINDVPVTNLSDGKPARCTVASTDIAKFKNGQFVEVRGADASHAKANGFHRISSVNSPANTFVLDEVDTSGSTAAQTSGVLIDPATTTGRGYINLSVQDADAESLISVEVYYDKLSVFSTEATQLWAVDPDPLQNAFVQLLRDSGTLARRSALQYGSGDVLYLDPSGIRSLKAKDSSNSASVSDIGSPIDPFLQQIRRSKGAGYMNQAIALLEPAIGRFWMVFPNEVLVLSYFPGPKITAWSHFTLPFTVKHATTCGDKIYIRDTVDRIWVYGGANGQTYEDCGVEIRLPYLNGKKPGHNKLFEAIDMTIQGNWEVRVSYNFNDMEAEEVVGNFSASTWNGGRAELTGYSSHMSLRFYNSDDAFASLSNVAIHYQVQDDEQ